jgi:hypothetical protein
MVSGGFPLPRSSRACSVRCREKLEFGSGPDASDAAAFAPARVRSEMRLCSSSANTITVVPGAERHGKDAETRSNARVW